MVWHVKYKCTVCSKPTHRRPPVNQCPACRPSLPGCHHRGANGHFDAMGDAAWGATGKPPDTEGETGSVSPLRGVAATRPGKTTFATPQRDCQDPSCPRRATGRRCRTRLRLNGEPSCLGVSSQQNTLRGGAARNKEKKEAKDAQAAVKAGLRSRLLKKLSYRIPHPWQETPGESS